MYLGRNTVTHPRHVYTSSPILISWCHFTRRERFYGDLLPPATLKPT